MKKVISVKYNWHQVGSVQDKDGAGEDWGRFVVGLNGVVSITEDESFRYLVELENGKSFRIFNPNFVEYGEG